MEEILDNMGDCISQSVGIGLSTHLLHRKPEQQRMFRVVSNEKLLEVFQVDSIVQNFQETPEEKEDTG